MRYKITHTCGHTQEHDLFEKPKNRERKIEWLKSTVCTECYKAQQQAAAAEATSNMELPSLDGSEKQIAWAESIRAKMIEAGIEKASTETSARWFIDNRDFDKRVDFIKASFAAPKTVQQVVGQIMAEETVKEIRKQIR